MRSRAGGRVLLGCGVLLGIVGFAMAAAFGPDQRLELGPEELSSAGPSVVTAPGAIGWSGPVVEISAHRADDAPVFVGVGQHVHVADYVARTSYTRIDDLSLSGDVTTAPVRGDRAPAAPPGELDWWLVRDEGDGAASVRLPLPDAAVDVVVMDPERQPGLEVEVAVSWVVEGVFVGGLGLLVAGVGLVLLGRRWVRRS